MQNVKNALSNMTNCNKKIYMVVSLYTFHTLQTPMANNSRSDFFC